MGGLAIFVSICVPFLILSDYRAAAASRCSAPCSRWPALGFADDVIKLRRRRSLGVSGRTKLMVQALTAIALWLTVDRVGRQTDTLRLRVVDASIDLGLLYPVLIFLVLAGATNGVNLTDGLDGLAAGCCAIVFLTFTAMTFITQGEEDLALLCACLVGACVGFLWFNSFPASVFMGDTGSLGLGGAIAALAVLTKTEILLIVIGGIFVIEALSVAIQVVAFQRFRKRVFLMAPIHHHFELMAGPRRRSSCASGSWPRSARRSASPSTSSRSRDRGEPRPRGRPASARGRIWWWGWRGPDAAAARDAPAPTAR